MTTDDLDRLEALCAAATAGPWWPRYGGEPGRVYSSAADVVVCEVPREVSDDSPRADSLFIAAARTAVPALLAELKTARQGNDALAARVRELEAEVRDLRENTP